MLNENGSVTFDPTAAVTIQSLAGGETATDTFTFTISDGNGGFDTATATLTVLGVNDAPVVGGEFHDGIPEQVTAGEAFSFTLAAKAFTDVDIGDLLSYEAVQLVDGSYEAELPEWLSFDLVTRTFSGEPQTGDFGDYLILVRVTDQHGASASETFTLNVETPPPPPNEPPIINTDAATPTDHQAIAFDGAGYVDITHPEVFTGGDAYTYVARFNTSFAGDWQSIITVGNLSHNQAAQLWITPDGQLAYGINDIFEIGHDENEPTVNDGFWHTVAVVHDGTGNHSLYLDGTLIASALDVGSPDIASGSALIGSATLVGGGDHLFHGAIDDVSIWNVALTPSQIQDSLAQPPSGAQAGLISYYSFDFRISAIPSSTLPAPEMERHSEPLLMWAPVAQRSSGFPFRM